MTTKFSKCLQRTAGMDLNELDRVEIISLQDNYIEMTAMDDSDIVRRAKSVREGEIRKSIGAEHGFSALVRMTRGGRTRTLLFDFGFSEHGTAYNADALDAVIGPTAEELRKIGPDYVIPCHCTGRKAIMQVEKAMPGQFILSMSGTTLTFRA